MASSSSEKSSNRNNLIYVYTGKGAGARSALSVARSLSASLPLADVQTLSTSGLLEGSWMSSSNSSSAAAAVALVMPGGADLPYCADLDGRGNELIRSFVEERGGSYLGFCAGAYYGCSRVEFEVDSNKLRVEGDRELAFFPGVALGAVVPGFSYETEAGAAATRLRWRRGRERKERSKGERGSTEEEEDEEEAEWSECLDYCNGGPVFVLRGSGSGEGTGRVLPDDSEVKGVAVEVLARYSSSPVFPSSCSSSPAVAAAAEGGAAAVRCTVGRGVAVLCGTHPELRPAAAWLLSPEGGGEKAAAATATEEASAAEEENEKVFELVSALDDDAAASAERERFWESLLDAAGLGGLR